jgi:hypothetical protein
MDNLLLLIFIALCPFGVTDSQGGLQIGVLSDFHLSRASHNRPIHRNDKKYRRNDNI